MYRRARGPAVVQERLPTRTLTASPLAERLEEVLQEQKCGALPAAAAAAIVARSGAFMALLGRSMTREEYDRRLLRQLQHDHPHVRAILESLRLSCTRQQTLWLLACALTDLSEAMLAGYVCEEEAEDPWGG